MKLDRLVSILVILLRKEKVSARELADMFEVSTRTILRDVDAINLAGIPIVTYQGANGGIGIAEGYRLDKSVLTGDDMAAIITALKGVDATIPNSRYEVLMEKLKNTLPPAQLDNLNDKLKQFIIDFSPWNADGNLKASLSDIRKAIQDHKELQFLYIDSAGKTTNRVVEPYSLVLKAQKWYLYAWCSSRSDFRVFKLSRIKELTMLDQYYKPRKISLEEHPWDNDWRNQKNMVNVVLMFEKDVGSFVREWFREGVEELEDGRLIVNTLLPENNWLYGSILSFGTTVEVLQPPHIRKIIMEIARATYEKYCKK